MPIVSPIQRSFILGDEWLYYKIYCGSKTSDLILSEIIFPIAEYFISQRIIDKWFFIRYSDPKIHIRLRLHFIQMDALSEVIKVFNINFRQYLHQNLIWKVQTDTYQREIERYGENTMEITESLFFFESQMIIKVIDLCKGEKGETMRWLFGIRFIDSFLNDFKFDLNQKRDLITIFANSFNEEFNMNKAAKANLGQKYRRERQFINEALNQDHDKNNDMLSLIKLIEDKSRVTKPIIEEIIKMDSNNFLQCPLHDLIGSFTHMFCNRLFRSKQRLHEMVLYNFLQKYYESEIARKNINNAR